MPVFKQFPYLVRNNQKDFYHTNIQPHRPTEHKQTLTDKIQYATNRCFCWHSLCTTVYE